jgi:hypothetical protein
MANQYSKTGVHLTDTQRKILMTFIKNHPEAKFREYIGGIGKKAPCSDAYYYFRRREIHGLKESGKRTYHRTNNTLYHTVWSFPVEKLETTKPLELLSNFIDTINTMKRGRFQITELKQPAVLEIRESSR